MTDNKAAVLVVCLGNICRSPLGEALLRHHAETAGLATAITVDSAGTAGWHEGKPPSHGSIEAAARNGLDITGQRSRPVVAEDFSRFDLILAMDARNLADLKASA